MNVVLYNIANKEPHALEKTTFTLEGLQEAIKKNIDIIAPDCLVISEEFSYWEDSRRRIDLLAIDKQANLVVIELKRDETGAHMELQALRYAAMIYTMSFAKACEYFQTYLKKQNRDADAKEKMRKKKYLNLLSWMKLSLLILVKISESFWLHRILARN